jgi:hypothetical protein
MYVNYRIMLSVRLHAGDLENVNDRLCLKETGPKRPSQRSIQERRIDSPSLLRLHCEEKSTPLALAPVQRLVQSFPLCCVLKASDAKWEQLNAITADDW